MENISTDKISELLNSPDLVKNLQAVIGQFSGSGEKKADEESSIIEAESKTISTNSNDAVATSGSISSIASFLSENRTERLALLTALRPFLGPEKQQLVDSIIQILKASNIFLLANSMK